MNMLPPHPLGTIYKNEPYFTQIFFSPFRPVAQWRPYFGGRIRNKLLPSFFKLPQSSPIFHMYLWKNKRDKGRRCFLSWLSIWSKGWMTARSLSAAWLVSKQKYFRFKIWIFFIVECCFEDRFKEWRERLQSSSIPRSLPIDASFKRPNLGMDPNRLITSSHILTHINLQAFAALDLATIQQLYVV